VGVNFGGSVGVQQGLDAEDSLQFEVRPVVERVADGLRNHLRPRGKLLLGRGVAGDEPFVDTARPHGAPLVVIASQPRLGEGCELCIARYFLRGNMAVVVEYRHRGGVFVVELLRRLGMQKEILIQKLFRHSVSSSQMVSYSENVFYSMIRIFARRNRKNEDADGKRAG
jgi:hypothetical protein